MVRILVVAGGVALVAAAGMFGMQQIEGETALATEPEPVIEAQDDPGAARELAPAGAATVPATEVQDDLGAARGLAPQTPVPQAPAASAPARELVQQQTGTVCETKRGVCTVAPQPINSVCQCGEAVGRIVR